MLRKISYVLLCAGAVFSANVTAGNHALVQGVTLEYELTTNIPELFTNYTIWTINAICRIQIPAQAPGSEGNRIHVRGVHRSGAIDGQIIIAPDEFDIRVQDGDQVSLSAKAGAQVELTNKSGDTVKAVCRTVW